MIDITSDTIRFLILKIFCLSPIFQVLSNVDDRNLMCILFLSSVTDYVPYGS